MRSRLQDYEKKGVQASAELQVAARKVAWENARLRNFVASKGIAKEEVENFLDDCRRHDYQDPANRQVNNYGGHATGLGLAGPPLSIPVPRKSDRELAVVKSEAYQNAHEASSPLEAVLQNVEQHQSPMIHDSRAEESGLSPPTVGKSSRSSPSHDPKLSSPAVPDGVEESDYCSTFGDALAPQERGPSKPTKCQPRGPTNDQHQTSCEVAARIIAGMRWENDQEAVLAALGCNGTVDCTVKNTRVFQLMDMS